MTTEKLFELDPKKLFEYLVNNFGVEVPTEIITIDDMQKAGALMSQLTNEYSYLMQLASLAKVYCRTAKRYGSKEDHEDAVDRKEIIENMVDVVKHQYTAISRCVTIKIENNAELRMTEFR